MKFIKSIFLCTLFLTSTCTVSTPTEDIEIVKNSSISTLNYTISDFISDLAGKDGTEEWISFIPQGYKNNSRVAGVQVDINRHSDKYNLIRIQFIYNKEREVVKISKITIDGQSKSKLEFYKILIEIGINSIKSVLDL